MTKVLLILSIVVVVSLLAFGVAIAVGHFQINASSHVIVVTPTPTPTITQAPIPPDYTIGLYSDPGCTIPVTLIEWGPVTQGDSSQITAYVKNLGNQEVTITSSSNLSAALGTLTSNSPVLLPGSSNSLTFTLSILSDATPNDYLFSITVES